MSEGDRTRKLAALVLESLRHDDLDTLCAREGVSIEELAALRHAFIHAGTARLREAVSPVSWAQINITLDPPGEQWGKIVGRPIRGIVRRWLDERLIDAFHFVHKPPGMRMRFLGARARMLPALDALFGDLVREGVIRAFTRGAYDAEVYQFGGEAGIDAAHAFFTVESLAVLRFHELQIAGEASVGPPELSLILLDLFFRLVTDDAWERWDLWNKMDLTGRSLAAKGEDRARLTATARAAGAPVARVIADPAKEIDRLPAPERDLIRAYQEALPPIAAQVRALHAEGKLLYPLREILPFWVIFHFNRMGFGAEDQSFLSFLMTVILSPKGEPGAIEAAR